MCVTLRILNLSGCELTDLSVPSIVNIIKVSILNCQHTDCTPRPDPRAPDYRRRSGFLIFSVQSLSWDGTDMKDTRIQVSNDFISAWKPAGRVESCRHSIRAEANPRPIDCNTNLGMPNEAGKGTETLSRMECEAVPTEGEVALAAPHRGLLNHLYNPAKEEKVQPLKSLIKNITEKSNGLQKELLNR